MIRDRETGVALVNVLVVLTLTASVVTVMSTGQDSAIARTRDAAAAAQAQALVRGGEASVQVALARDAVAATDHLGEAWAQVQQSETTLETGRFALSITDVQGRFDINRLKLRTALDLQLFLRIAKLAEVGPGEITQTIRIVARDGPLHRLEDLTAFGVSAETVARLRPHVAAWPKPGTINLNSAGAVVFGALLGNPREAARLLRQRDRQGVLTEGDLVPPPGAGFTSDIYDVVTLAEVDGVVLRLTSRLVRADGRVRVVARRFGWAP